VKRPLVTIGIAAFNAADSLELAVRSALAQTWRPIEIVAVDDCSSDQTANLLDTLARDNSELRVFRNETNQGVGAVRNRILAEARGEFVVFFDDDDESRPARVAVQLARLTQYEDRFAEGAMVVCHTARAVHFPNGRTRVEPTMGERLEVRAPAGLPVARRILLGTPLKDGYGSCATCSQAARLSTYRALNGFDPALRRGEDTDFAIRLAKAGGHFVGISEPLVTQNMTKTQEKSLAEEYRNLLLLVEKHRDVMDEAGQYAFCRRWLELKQAWLERRRADFLLSLAALAARHPVLTARRLVLAIPNIGLNRSFSRFHLQASTE
jgi:glycosyltransferase involved in cell wall biosynthesis